VRASRQTALALMPRQGNRLLSALPDDAWERIEGHLERLALDNGTVLHKRGEEIRDLYFPLDCLISITVKMRDNRIVETGVVGSREVVGINAFMGGRETTQTEYIVQIAGDAMRIDSAPLREAFDTDRRVRDVFLKLTQAMIAQISQTAACNSLHSLEKRYARWLLEVHDRVQADEIRLTHKFMAEMLGVRRAGITELANKFQRDGLLTEGYGWTQIVDRPGLEAAACECYSVLREEYERLLGETVDWAKT
jgi:CRP-like cAMP-binding protein